VYVLHERVGWFRIDATAAVGKHGTSTISHCHSTRETTIMTHQILFSWDVGGSCWVAEVPTMPGLVAANETLEGLFKALEDAMKVYVNYGHG